MKQLLQRLDSGETTLVDVPVPGVSGPNLLVQTRATVVSAGTERMLVDFGRANLLQKARSQPEKVRQVVGKIRTDGVRPTLEAVRSKLGVPIPLGYCHAGVVVGTGSRSGGFTTGDRVVTNGPHSEYVRVPHTLAARIPDGVSFEHAAFTPLAAIGLQGIRLADPTLGETVVVAGLGLIGLLTVQLLRANGCRVIGLDPDARRLALAEEFGATALEVSEDVPEQVRALTGGVGADAVLLTLTSSSDEPVRQAAAMSRKRGRLVLVGVTGLDLVREDFYRKELSFAVSCSYGPGRYDPDYEERAQDYPLGYVRWTEQRNFQAVLELMADGALDPARLITHRFPFPDAPAAYDLISGEEPNLGVVLEYEARDDAVRPSHTLELRTPAPSPGVAGVAVVGAGNFATRTLLPALKAADARLRVIASDGGTSAAIAGRRFDFERTTTQLDEVFDDPAVGTVFLLTRHNSHAGLAARGLAAGKHVFVEKPLALTHDELDDVMRAAASSGHRLMVGFNRRFARDTIALRKGLLGRAGPLSLVMTVNAGHLPAEHWTQDPAVGGGRIVGEACHWIDLARHLTGSGILSISVTTARDAGGRVRDDISHLMLGFEDGSTAVVNYLANGCGRYEKERIEAHWDAKSAVIENWRRLVAYGWSGSTPFRRRGLDKGHNEELARWLAATQSGELPIPVDELFEVSARSIDAAALAFAGGGTWNG